MTRSQSSSRVSNFSKLAIVLVATLLSAPGCTSQKDVSAADAGRRADIYDVYSAMFANPDPGDRVYFIDAKTNRIQLDPPSTPAIPSSFDSEECFAIPPTHRVAWNEIRAETNARKNSPGTLERELKIKTPYVILTAADLREVGDAIGKGIRPQNPKFQGGTTLITLGDVYFNQKRTLALTSFSSICGSLCGSSAKDVYEKGADGKWQSRPDWVTCHWVS